MNNILTSTIGIDTVIQSIQTDLYEELSSVWSGTFDGYGRVYKNINNDGEVHPEWFIDDNEYKEVYYNDEMSGNFMFIVGDTSDTEDSVVYTTDVKCAFMVDLKKILPSSTDRADSEANRDVVSILRDIANSRFSITGIETKVRNVFRDFETKGIKFEDIHPNYCFSVNLKLSYYLTDKCE